jgi:G3E family GTPase
MPEPLRAVAVNLITGRRGAGKSSVIRRLLAQRPAGERWAVLYNDVPAAGESTPDPELDDVRFSLMAEGCICCSAQVGLRVALTRLLRDARPQRLLIEPSSQARVNEVLKLLADRWLAPVLDVRATILVVNAAQHAGAPLAHELDRERIAHAQVIALHQAGRAADEGADGLAELEHALAAIAPRATMLKSLAPDLDVALLDTPGHAVRPHFHSSV